MNYIKVGLGVLINDDNKILLGHYSKEKPDTGGIYEPDTWCLPGGKQDYQETIFDCAKRETKEETNLDIDNLFVYNVVDNIGSDRHFIDLWVVARSWSGDLKVMESEVIDEWKWFKFDELPDNLYSPSKEFILDYLERGINNDRY